MPFKLHFFKVQPTQPTKARQKVSTLSFLTGIAFVLITSILLYTPQEKLPVNNKLKVGDIAKQDIVIHRQLLVEDKEKTNETRKKVLENLPPVYDYFPENLTKTENAINSWFQFIINARNSYVASGQSQNELNRLKTEIENQLKLELSESDIRMILGTQIFNRVDINPLINLLHSIYNKKLVYSINEAQKNKEGLISLALKNNRFEYIKIDPIYDVRKAQSSMVDLLKQQNISQTSSEFIASILKEFLQANVVYSFSKTEEAQANAAAQVKPAVVELKPGRVIIRKGDEVKPDHLKILQMIAESSDTEENRLPNFYLILLILSLLTMFGGKFFRVWFNTGINKDKLFVVTGATILVGILLYKLFLFLLPIILRNININIPYDVSSIFYAIPCGFGVLAISFIFNLQSAVVFSFVNALLGGILCDWNFNVFIYILLGNLAASFGIEYFQRLKRTPIIKAALIWMLPVNVAAIMFFHLTKIDLDMAHLFVNIGMGIFSAIMSPIIANFIIPIWENIFRLITELKLIELTNLNLPIFREMLEKAPGTYHHSLMVASLAESVAQDLEMSPLLERAMALYHDIGKIDNPHYFTENHTIYKNPHENLSPRESAKNIISHIPNGIERAEKLKIPPMIMSSIKQHHGCKRVRFFFEKAREMSAVDNDDFDDRAFRYQGEKPKNIENAIVMLADQVEAASKSLASPSDEEIKNVIQRIIDVNIEEEQFDECEGLTFKSINIIANSFLKKLSSIYHMRISYPGFNFREKDKENSGEHPRLRLNTDKVTKMVQ